MINREKLKEEFLTKCNLGGLKRDKLRRDASYRSYERIYLDDKTYILMDAPPEKEPVSSFIVVADYLRSLKLSSPEIIFKDEINGFLVLEDFGTGQFTKLLASQEEYNEDISEARFYEKAIDALIHLHKSNNLPNVGEYDESMLIKESMQFIEWYVTVLNNAKLSKKSQDDFVLIWKHLLKQIKIFPQVLVHRDFHADNLMWLEDRISIRKVGILDFQDAVLGSPVYDIVSLLEDARRDVSQEVVEAVITRYLRAFPQYNRKDFLASYAILGAQRNLKIVGFCTRQAAFNKNPTYLSLLPRVWNYINNDLKHPLLLPLKNWLDAVLPHQTKNFVNNIYSSAPRKILV